MPTHIRLTLTSVGGMALAIGCAQPRHAESVDSAMPRERAPATEQVAAAKVGEVRSVADGRGIAAEAQYVIGDALRAVQKIDASADAPAFRDYLHRAVGVFIFPNVPRDALAAGESGMPGVLLAKNADGLSEPAFFSIAPGNTGLRFAFDRSDVVLFLMNDDTLEAALDGGLDSASLTGGTLAADGHVGTLGSAADVISLIHSDGQLYPGPAFQGVVIRPLPTVDRAYYGEGVDSRTVVRADATPNAGARPLTTALARMSAPWQTVP